MSLFDDIEDDDDIFSPTSKPKRVVKKPSFEELLDDESDLFAGDRKVESLSPIRKSADNTGAVSFENSVGASASECSDAREISTSDNKHEPTPTEEQDAIPEENMAAAKGSYEGGDSDGELVESYNVSGRDADLSESYKETDNDDSAMTSPKDVSLLEDSSEALSTSIPVGVADSDSVDGVVFNDDETFEQNNDLRQQKRNSISQDQIVVLTSRLQMLQSENEFLKTENERMVNDLDYHRGKVIFLEEQGKLKDETIRKREDEISHLKAAKPSSSHRARLPSRKSSTEIGYPKITARTKLKSGVDKGRTVTSVADSVKKFSGAATPETGRSGRSKVITKRPELKGSASPAVEGRASTAAKSSSGVARGSPAAKKPTPSESKPRLSVTKRSNKSVEEAAPTAVEKPAISSSKPTSTEKVAMDSNAEISSTNAKQDTHNVISMFEKKNTTNQTDTPVWKKQLKNREKESTSPDDRPSSSVADTNEEKPCKGDPDLDRPASVNGMDHMKATPSHTKVEDDASSTSNAVHLREKKNTSNIADEQKKMSTIDPGKRTSWQPKREECAVCNRVVYAMERLEADKVVFHKTCFKCSVCIKTLSTGTYAALQGKIYCKVHFKQLFKIKGNYDEGFGREQHKAKWAKKEDGEMTD